MNEREREKERERERDVISCRYLFICLCFSFISRRSGVGGWWMMRHPSRPSRVKEKRAFEKIQTKEPVEND